MTRADRHGNGNRLPALDFSGGTWITIAVSVCSVVLAVALGLLGAWGKLGASRVANSVTNAYTTLIRGGTGPRADAAALLWGPAAPQRSRRRHRVVGLHRDQPLHGRGVHHRLHLRRLHDGDVPGGVSRDPARSGRGGSRVRHEPSDRVPPGRVAAARALRAAELREQLARSAEDDGAGVGARSARAGVGIVHGPAARRVSSSASFS